MRLYVDTADRAVGSGLLATGLFVGLTTNPTILQRSGLGVAAVPDIYKWATAAGAQEVFFQSWGLTSEELIERGVHLRELGDEVVVKLVASRAGSAACAALARRGMRTALHDGPGCGRTVLHRRTDCWCRDHLRGRGARHHVSVASELVSKRSRKRKGNATTTIAVNVLGVVHGDQAAARRIIAQGRGGRGSRSSPHPTRPM